MTPRARLSPGVLAAMTAGIAWFSIGHRLLGHTSVGRVIGAENDPGMAVSTAIALTLLSAAVYLLAEKKRP